ncbi:M23 family metallopeptidase [Kineosporia rhizophila]|uniref:M23 family metallopeptidase n=1 Tax=Kineosporia rhizophila TaxID=84633 RepID=UPI000A40F65E|nr:M23 family metallopeptidase [Kineosporia rhizophila]MCE0534546.1 M23 family metallopeptidase [Kineosporia rhizophila]
MKATVLALYRVRMPIYLGAAVILIGNVLSGAALPPVLPILALVAVVLCLALVVLGPKLLPVPEPRVVTAPVRGRWLGINSPATKTPSHGIRAYGQAYAIDLVHEPEADTRPQFGVGPALRPNHQYPAFGQPVLAMIDGEVVKASGWRRDHRSRSTTAALLYMFAEGMVREIGGPGFILGNHVVIRGEDGIFAAVAHLQQGSLKVRVGDRVHAGDQVGSCGNSGNSSEPHVHAQLMDRASPTLAQGLPMAFAAVTIEADQVDGLPANDQHMSA